jgi:hypothetical protein
MAINKLSSSGLSNSKKSKAVTTITSDFPAGLAQYGFNNSSTNAGSYGSLLTNTTTFTTSPVKFGTHAASFNGTSGYMNVALPPSLQTVTVAFWVYVRDTSARSYVVDFRPPDTAPYGYWLYDNTGTATFGGDSEYVFTYTPTLNTWQHWAMVVNGATGTMTWYQNGSVLANASRTCLVNNSGYFTLGTYYGVAGGNQDQYFSNFVVDNLYVSDKALTATEVSALYNYNQSF